MRRSENGATGSAHGAHGGATISPRLCREKGRRRRQRWTREEPLLLIAIPWSKFRKATSPGDPDLAANYELHAARRRYGDTSADERGGRRGTGVRARRTPATQRLTTQCAERPRSEGTPSEMARPDSEGADVSPYRRRATRSTQLTRPSPRSRDQRHRDEREAQRRQPRQQHRRRVEHDGAALEHALREEERDADQQADHGARARAR